jgi:hypothetical protein
VEDLVELLMEEEEVVLEVIDLQDLDQLHYKEQH